MLEENNMTGHEEMRKLVKQAKIANEQRCEAHSKANLKRHIETKFKTTMIGALANFEKVFGDLWGHGLPEDLLTDEQLENKKRWELVRTEVLNNGNNQMRAALLEVDQNTIRYNKMEYKFLVNKDSKELTQDG